MAFTDSEIARMRFELGYNVLGFDASPYIGITSVFDSVIQSSALSGAATTSATSVSEATTPTPATIVVASATDLAAGVRIVVDVDSRAETVTIQSVSSTNVTAIFSKAHSGTYPVAVESGETIAREILAQIKELDSQTVSRLTASGIKKVDEIEFQSTSGGRSATSDFTAARDYLRDQLASALGVPNLHRGQSARASRCEVY